MTLTQDQDGRWRLDTNGELLGYDGENMASVLCISADTGENWTYYMDVEYATGERATMPLVYEAGTLHADATAGYLKPGRTMMQIRGVDGDLVKKSNISRVSIGVSINATQLLEPPSPSLWDTYAAQVAEMRDEAQSALQKAENAAEQAEQAAERAEAAADAIAPYEGEYTVKPDFAVQTLPTTDKTLRDDVTVEAIEVSRVSNQAGGTTVYIGGIF